MSRWPRSRQIVFVVFIWFLIVLACVLGDRAGNQTSSKPQEARRGVVDAAQPITPKVKKKAVRKAHRASRSAVVRVKGIAPHTPAMRYAADLMNTTQFACLSLLWHRESGWSPRSRTGSHFGIAQLRGETSTDPLVQVDHGLAYIEHRYGSPCGAWAHSQNTGWY